MTILKFIFGFLIFMCSYSLNCQTVEVEGKLKVSNMDTINTENLLVVKRSDGTLAGRQVTSLPAPSNAGDTTRTLERDFLLTSALCECSSLPPAMIKSLLDNGYSHGDLVDFNIATSDLLSGGLSLAQLIAAGESVSDLLNEGYSLAQLIDAGATILYLTEGGVFVSELLAIGLSPFHLYGEGIMLDSLYGKLYQDGLIFFVDIAEQYPEFEGLVVFPNEVSDNREWGCYATNVFGADGSTIGTGAQNTIDIVDENCFPQPNAASSCTNWISNSDYEDWFLPSRLELGLIYSILAINGLGEFIHEYYYSSTEFNANSAYYRNFYTGSEFYTTKQSDYYYRPVRAF